jgi:hypothetical protein
MEPAVAVAVRLDRHAVLPTVVAVGGHGMSGLVVGGRAQLGKDSGGRCTGSLLCSPRHSGPPARPGLDPAIKQALVILKGKGLLRHDTWKKERIRTASTTDIIARRRTKEAVDAKLAA